MSDAPPEWHIECQGGCGRVLITSKPTVLWMATMCPECKANRD